MTEVNLDVKRDYLNNNHHRIYLSTLQCPMQHVTGGDSLVELKELRKVVNMVIDFYDWTYDTL